jgi:hypothetical protein
MMFMAITGGVIAGSIALGMLYDWRARRHGWSVSASTEEALNSRLDVKAIHNPYLQGGTQDWMTYRHRDA